jgi:hypothetical protein
MCLAVALLRSDIPEPIVERHALQDRVYNRGGTEEVRFDWRREDAVLPVIDGGVLRIVAWGSKSRKGPLPPTGWTWLETVESGGWTWATPEPVVVPAVYGFEKGIWFKITEGIRAILVTGPDGTPHAYMLCEPATRYYRVMTRSERMPCLLGEVI